MTWKLLTGPPKSAEQEIAHLIKRRSKLLVDESLGIGVAEVLKDWGEYNVKFGPNVGLGGRSDQEVFAYAWRDKCILLTPDRDFLDDREFPFHRNSGVVVLPGEEGEEVPLARALGQMLSIFGAHGGTFPNAKIIIDAEMVWRVKSYHREDGRIERYELRFTHGRTYRRDIYRSA